MPSPIDLQGLQSSPIDYQALKGAFDHLSKKVLPWRCPHLSREDHENVANQALKEKLPTISDIEDPEEIIFHAVELARTLQKKQQREWKRMPTFSLDQTTDSHPSPDMAKDMNDASTAAWKEDQDEAGLLERFVFAMEEVLPRLTKREQDFTLAYLDFLRANPTGTNRAFAKLMGFKDDKVNVTMMRIRDKVAELMKKGPPNP